MTEFIPSPNRLVHEPARLAILTVLSSCVSADFVFLQGITGLSKGNLSVQLSNLEEAGLINVRRELLGKKTRTRAQLTEQGAVEIKEYWKTMDEIRSRMESQGKRKPSVAKAIQQYSSS